MSFSLVPVYLEPTFFYKCKVPNNNIERYRKEFSINIKRRIGPFTITRKQSLSTVVVPKMRWIPRMREMDFRSIARIT